MTAKTCRQPILWPDDLYGLDTVCLSFCKVFTADTAEQSLVVHRARYKLKRRETNTRADTYMCTGSAPRLPTMCLLTRLLRVIHTTHQTVISERQTCHARVQV